VFPESKDIIGANLKKKEKIEIRTDVDGKRKEGEQLGDGTELAQGKGSKSLTRRTRG